MEEQVPSSEEPPRPPLGQLTKEAFKRHFSFEKLSGESTDANEPTVSFKKFEGSKSMGIAVMLLKVSPWLCLLSLFGTWGMEMWMENLSDSFSLLGFSVSWLAFIDFVKTVAVGGMIGYGTNFLAIKMLFRPIKKRPIWGQGMIPAQRDIIIYTLAGGIHKHVLNRKLIQERIEESGIVSKLSGLLISGSSGLLQDEKLRTSLKVYLHDMLTEQFEKEDFRDHLHDLINRQVEQKAQKGIKKWALTAYKKFNSDDYSALIDQVITDIPDSIMELTDKLEEEIEKAALYLEDQKEATETYLMDFTLDFLGKLDEKAHELLAGQMKGFDEAKLERMVWEATNEQLLYIQYLGTILGMLGGLVIWDGRVLGVYLLLVGLLYGLDELIFRYRK